MVPITTLVKAFHYSNQLYKVRTAFYVFPFVFWLANGLSSVFTAQYCVTLFIFKFSIGHSKDIHVLHVKMLSLCHVDRFGRTADLLLANLLCIHKIIIR